MIYIDPPPLFAPPTDPNAHPDDAARLTGQNAAILAMLRERPRTNVELAAVSLKYTSRTNDLRNAGYTIICTRGHGGVNTYTLVTP